MLFKILGCLLPQLTFELCNRKAINFYYKMPYFKTNVQINAVKIAISVIKLPHPYPSEKVAGRGLKQRQHFP